MDFFAMDIARGEGEAGVTLDLADNHLNPNGVAHGAVAFTMMDTAMGAAVVSLLDTGKHCATVEIHTRFHRPVTSGRLRCRAEVTTPGRRLMHVDARTVDDQDRLIASASATFIII